MSGSVLSQGPVVAGSFVSGGVKDFWLPVPITGPLPSGETDTGVDLPPNAYVLDVLLNVIAPEVTAVNKAIQVGILTSESGGDYDGFIAALSVANAGLKRPSATILAAGNEWYFGETTRGEFLSPRFRAGANVAGDVGTCYEQAFDTSSITGKSVSVRTAGGTAFVEFRGVILFHILQLAS